jgi:hypothetical protein
MELRPDTKSIHYERMIKEWIKISVIMAGDPAIKEAGQIYLPKLTGQTPAQYKAYKNRGVFFNAFDRTVVGFSGAIVKKNPIFEVSPRIKEMLPHITVNNESIEEVTEIIGKNLLSYGYYGILVDMPVVREGDIQTDEPYFALYTCDAILNPLVQREGSENKLIRLTLAETVERQNPKNKYEIFTQDVIRELAIEDGILVVRLYEKKEIAKDKYEWVQIGDDMYPAVRGKKLNYIPFVFFGAVTNDPTPKKPPLETLANLNIKHWQVTVDYYHAIHYCCMPTPWAAGFPKSSELYVGGEKAWVSENPDAKCGYLELVGKSLEYVQNAMDRLENQMAVAGAKILEARKNAAETAETVRLHFSGDSASLSSIVSSIEAGLIKAFEFMSLWIGEKPKCVVKLNREFVSDKLSSQDIIALLQAWQGGGISLNTFLMNMKNGEILGQDQTIEDEKLRIEAEGSKPGKSNNIFGLEG